MLGRLYVQALLTFWLRNETTQTYIFESSQSVGREGGVKERGRGAAERTLCCAVAFVAVLLVLLAYLDDASRT